MRYFSLLLAMLIWCGTALAQTTDGPATLPTGFSTTNGVFSTAFPNTTGYTIATVPGTYPDYQTALNSVACNTIIKLAAGSTYTGSFNLVRTCPAGQWRITMVSTCNNDGTCPVASGLPSQGTRVTTGEAGSMAKLVACSSNCNNVPTLNVAGNYGTSGLAASGYWFGPGIEILPPADASCSGSGGSVTCTSFQQGGLVLDNHASALSISNIVYDRVLGMCPSNAECARIIATSGDHEAIVDSVLIGAHGGPDSQQAQAWWEGEGVGPYKVVNNELGGSGMGSLAGGAGCPANSGLPPHDLEYAGNYVHYDLGTGSILSFWAAANVGNTRAILEMKEGLRWLVQGNYMDGGAVAQNAPNGTAFAYGILERASDNPGNGGCTTNYTQDVTTRFNKILHPAIAIDLQGGNDQAAAPFFKNFSVHDNMADDINRVNGTSDSTAGTAMTIDTFSSPPSQNILINHNTFISSTTGHSWMDIQCPAAPFLPTFVITNNIALENSFGFSAFIFAGGQFTTTYTGGNGWEPNCFNTPFQDVVSSNLSIGTVQATWKPGNTTGIAIASVGFTNYNGGNGGNYQLLGTSPYITAASDGGPLGVSNWSCLNSMTAAAFNGTYTELIGACASGGGSVAPVVVITPVTITLGNSQQGNAGGMATATVTNSGTATLVLNTPYFNISGSNPLDFSNLGTGTCANGASVGIGLSCTVNLQFTPALASSESATLNILGNANGSASMTGTGTARGIARGMSVR